MKLYTQADDLGSFAAANRAILDAVEHGILRNTGVMVVCPAFEQAAQMFRGRKDVCVGLHTTFNAEWENVRWRPVLPAEQVPWICETDGTLQRSVLEIHHSITDAGVAFPQMLAEVKAQLEKARAAGLDIVYLDAHCAFGWVHGPGRENDRFQKHLAQFAQREGLIFFSNDSPRQSALVPLTLPSDGGDVVDRTCAALRAAARTDGTYFLGGHPALLDEEMKQVWHHQSPPGQQAQQRYWDYRRLVDLRVLEVCRQEGIVPVKITEL